LACFLFLFLFLLRKSPSIHIGINNDLIE